MADDRMKNDDRQRNMGGANREDQDYGQQTPGRGQQPEGGQQGAQKGTQKHQMEDDKDLDTGRQGGAKDRGQNR